MLSWRSALANKRQTAEAIKRFGPPTTNPSQVAYLVWILPEPAQLCAYDALRQRVAAATGSTRALDYFAPHVTLISGIREIGADPLDLDQLRAALDQHANTGAIELPVLPLHPSRHDLILPVAGTGDLASLRNALYAAVRDVAGGTGLSAALALRAAMIHTETKPHLTIAMEIDPARRSAGAALIAEQLPNLPTILRCTDLALLARDIIKQEPYKIVHRVSLLAPTEEE